MQTEQTPCGPVRSVFLRRLFPRVTRTVHQFAEQELLLPKGPRRGMLFSVGFMPLVRFVFDAMHEPRWRKVVIIGPTQSGKSLIANNLPILYYLFEQEDDIIIGLPSLDLAKGLWQEKILPVIEGTRYRNLLPTKGAGSQGGVPSAIRLKNGAFMRFMGAGGGDAQRSSHTARIIIMTEVDKMDDIGSASEESDPVRQIEMRADAFEDSKIIMESTVTHEQGRIWVEGMVLGSGGQVFVPCPACGHYQTLRQEGLHFAPDNVVAAEESARYKCEKCGDLWDDQKRRAALQRPVLAHRGQTVSAGGQVSGDLPPTRTFGLHWNVLYSPMQSLGKTAALQWEADQGDENAKKGMRQSKWALPWKVEKAASEVSWGFLSTRAERSPVKLGLVPKWADWIVLTADVQKRVVYWHCEAYARDATSQVIEYGYVDIMAAEVGTSITRSRDVDPSEDAAEKDANREAPESAIVRALDELSDIAAAGWPGEDGAQWMPKVHLVDIGYRTDVVLRWLRNRSAWSGVKGRAHGERAKIGGRSVFSVQGLLQIRAQDDGSLIWLVDVDQTKALVHDRFFIEEGRPGYTWLPKDVTRTYLFHLSSERREYESDGQRFRWVAQKGRRRNDWLDCRSYGVAAQKFLVQVEDVEKQRQAEVAAQDSVRPEISERFVESGSTGGWSW